jgi:hypothetical protein
VPLSRTTWIAGIFRVNREIIKPLAAWNLDVCSKSLLQPGAILSACRILHNHAPGAEPYVVEFDFAGHHYSCPLFAFQPRTQSLTATVEQKTDRAVMPRVPPGPEAVPRFSTSLQS